MLVKLLTMVLESDGTPVNPKEALPAGHIVLTKPLSLNSRYVVSVEPLGSIEYEDEDEGRHYFRIRMASGAIHYVEAPSSRWNSPYFALVNLLNTGDTEGIKNYD